MSPPTLLPVLRPFQEAVDYQSERIAMPRDATVTAELTGRGEAQE